MIDHQATQTNPNSYQPLAGPMNNPCLLGSVIEQAGLFQSRISLTGEAPASSVFWVNSFPSDTSNV